MYLQTCVLILVGVVFFVLGDVTQSILFKSKELTCNDANRIQEINVPNYMVVSFIVFDFIVLLLVLKEIIDITGGIYGSIGSAIGQYRYAYAYTDYKSDIVNVQLLKISKGAAYAFLFIIINNIIKTKKVSFQLLKYMLPVILFGFITLVKGGRINAIMLIISGLFLYYYINRRVIGWNKSVSIKFIKIIFMSFLAFVILFFGTREFVGRKETTLVSEYITTYIGCSFQLFDQFIRDPIVNDQYLETFPGIIQTLNRLNLSDIFPHKALEFRYSPTGVHLGNVYTGLRRYYHDFGIIGIISIQFVYGFIFSYVYRVIRQMRYLNSNRLFILVTYASMLFCIITQSIEDHFWIDLSLGLIIELVIMKCIIRIIMDYRISQHRLTIRNWIG